MFAFRFLFRFTGFGGDGEASAPLNTDSFSEESLEDEVEGDRFLFFFLPFFFFFLDRFLRFSLGERELETAACGPLFLLPRRLLLRDRDLDPASGFHRSLRISSLLLGGFQSFFGPFLAFSCDGLLNRRRESLRDRERLRLRLHDRELEEPRRPLRTIFLSN